jgi:hypothetical protein
MPNSLKKLFTLLFDAADAGKGSGDGTDAAAAAAAAGKTPEQLAAEQAAKAGEASTDAAKAAADAKAAEDAAKAAAAGAPEKYDLKIPEGAEAVLSAGELNEIEELAREANLPNDQAQSIVESTAALAAKRSETWKARLEADKTYGGEKLAETQQLANKFLDKVAPKGTPLGDELRSMLQSGVGNHLAIVAAMANAGRMMKEDGPVEGAAAAGATQAKSLEEYLYPNAPEFAKK